jgi:hypothetical protein
LHFDEFREYLDTNQCADYQLVFRRFVGGRKQIARRDFWRAGLSFDQFGGHLDTTNQFAGCALDDDGHVGGWKHFDGRRLSSRFWIWRHLHFNQFGDGLDPGQCTHQPVLAGFLLIGGWV